MVGWLATNQGFIWGGLLVLGLLGLLVATCWDRIFKSKQRIIELEFREIPTLSRVNNHFILTVKLTLRALRLPLRIDEMHLKMEQMTIEYPIEPKLPIKLEQKAQSLRIKYELPFYAPLFSITLGTDKAHLWVLAGGEEYRSKEFIIPLPQK